MYRLKFNIEYNHEKQIAPIEFRSADRIFKISIKIKYIDIAYDFYSCIFFTGGAWRRYFLIFDKLHLLKFCFLTEFKVRNIRRDFSVTIFNTNLPF